MRCFAPLTLGLLLLSPLLAHADALDGAFMVLGLVAAVWGLALLLMLLSLLAYRQPASPTLRVLNYVGIGLSLVLGLMGAIAVGAPSNDTLGLGAANPFLRLSLPVAAWLGGAHWATFETRPQARQWAVAVAAAGALPAVRTLLSLATSWLPPLGLTLGLAGYVVSELCGLLVAVGTWWVVLQQAQRRQPLGWHALRPVLLVPALATVLGTVYAYLPFVRIEDWQWLGLALLGLLGYSLLGAAVGAGAIWLNQRRRLPELSS